MPACVWLVAFHDTDYGAPRVFSTRASAQAWADEMNLERLGSEYNHERDDSPAFAWVEEHNVNP